MAHSVECPVSNIDTCEAVCGLRTKGNRNHDCQPVIRPVRQCEHLGESWTLGSSCIRCQTARRPIALNDWGKQATSGDEIDSRLDRQGLGETAVQVAARNRHRGTTPPTIRAAIVTFTP